MAKSNERQFRTDLPEDVVDAFVADLTARGMSQREGTLRWMRMYLALDEDARALGMGAFTQERTAAFARMLLRQLGKGKR